MRNKNPFISQGARLAQRAPQSGDQKHRPLEEELAEKLFKREALNEVENLLTRGDLAAARKLLRKTERKLGHVDARLFDTSLALDPTGDDLLFSVRAAVYAEARCLKNVTKDLVRAVLVTENTVSTLAMLARLADANDELAPWMEKALLSVGARMRGDEKEERQLLLGAIRCGPDEVALFAALARNTRHSGSDIELFALRQCVRCAPRWLAARDELHAAAKIMNDPDATRIEERPDPNDDGSKAWSYRRRCAA